MASIPDLTPRDFGFWAIIKDRVRARRPKPSKLGMLCTYINKEFDILRKNKALLVCVCVKEVKLRCKLVVDVDGGHFQLFIQ